MLPVKLAGLLMQSLKKKGTARKACLQSTLLLQNYGRFTCENACPTTATSFSATYVQHINYIPLLVKDIVSSASAVRKSHWRYVTICHLLDPWGKEQDTKVAIRIHKDTVQYKYLRDKTFMVFAIYFLSANAFPQIVCGAIQSFTDDVHNHKSFSANATEVI